MQSLIYLLRHGEVDTSRPRRFLGQTDLPLNDRGIAQARTVGQALAEISFQYIFSSPLCRALQTAALVSDRNPHDIQSVEPFKEINLGAWEGLSADEVRAQFPGSYEARGKNMGIFRPQGGESFADVAARALPPLQNLAAHHSGPLLIVAHAGVNRALLATLQGIPIDDLLTIPQDYCGVNILKVQRDTLLVESINTIFY